MLPGCALGILPAFKLDIAFCTLAGILGFVGAGAGFGPPVIGAGPIGLVPAIGIGAGFGPPVGLETPGVTWRGFTWRGFTWRGLLAIGVGIGVGLTPCIGPLGFEVGGGVFVPGKPGF